MYTADCFFFTVDDPTSSMHLFKVLLLWAANSKGLEDKQRIKHGDVVGGDELSAAMVSILQQLHLRSMELVFWRLFSLSPLSFTQPHCSEFLIFATAPATRTGLYRPVFIFLGSISIFSRVCITIVFEEGSWKDQTCHLSYNRPRRGRARRAA